MNIASNQPNRRRGVDQDSSRDNTQKPHNLQHGVTSSRIGTKRLKRIENPYYPAFDLLLAQLLAHEEILKIVPRIVSSVSEGTTKSATVAIGPDPMSDQSDGLVANICEMRNDGYVGYFPTFRFSHSTSETQSHVNQAFQRRCFGWIMAQSFESFRKFAEETDRRIPKHQSLWRRILGHMQLRVPETLTRRSHRSDLRSVVKRIRKATPALQKCENRNARGINLGSWLRMLSGMRHAIVHCEGIIAPTKWRKLKSGGRKMRPPGIEAADGSYVLDMTYTAVRDIIHLLREYSLVIYKAVSEATECPVTLYDSDKGMTVWLR